MFVFDGKNVNPAFLQGFLEPHEQRCVQLCSIVRKSEPNTFVFSKSGEIKSEDDIFGIANIDTTFLHCFPYISAKKKNDDFDKSILSVVQNSNVSCVNGEKLASEYIINLLSEHGKKIFQKNEYFLMTKEDVNGLPPPASLLSMGEEIVCCNFDHADDLVSLQKNYLIEEVIPKGSKPSDDYPKSNIEKILKEQKVFAIRSDGEFVAKANTNAIGWNWIQIGGVYTNPLYRRNNYALCLVSTLAHHINKNGRKTCLFVNKKNLPAISLYKKMNFKTECDFVICYLD